MYKEIESYVKIYPLVVGRSVRFNHSTPECHGKSKSAYLKRTDHGTYYFHCHRCGKSYTYSETYFRSRTPEKRIEDGTFLVPSPVTKHRHPVHTESSIKKFPSDYRRGVENVPSEGREQLDKFNVTSSEAKHHGIGWSKELGRIVFPLYNNTGIVAAGYRSYTAQPKWLTYKKPGEIWWELLAKGDSSEYHSRVVLTEDIISAIVVGRVFPAYPLLGVQASQAQLLYLKNKYGRLIVWLDNDNPTVKKTQRELARRISLLTNSETPVVRTSKDPKYYSDKEIIDIITGAVWKH